MEPCVGAAGWMALPWGRHPQRCRGGCKLRMKLGTCCSRCSQGHLHEGVFPGREAGIWVKSRRFSQPEAELGTLPLCLCISSSGNIPNSPPTPDRALTFVVVPDPHFAEVSQAQHLREAEFIHLVPLKLVRLVRLLQRQGATVPILPKQDQGHVGVGACSCRERAEENAMGYPDTLG